MARKMAGQVSESLDFVVKKRICACISLIVELCLKDSKAQEHVGVECECVCLSKPGWGEQEGMRGEGRKEIERKSRVRKDSDG